MTERNNHTVVTVIIVLAIIACVVLLVRNPFGFSTYSPASAASFSTYSSAGSYPSSGSFSTYPQNIISFNDCINAGYQVIPTYPEQCRTPGGQTFTQVIQPQSTTYYPPTTTYYPPTTTYYPPTQYQQTQYYYPQAQTTPVYQGNQGCYVNGYWMQSCPQD
jgi:hypothetical protein